MNDNDANGATPQFDQVEVIDLDSDELGEFDTLATCTEDVTRIKNLAAPLRVDIAMRVISEPLVYNTPGGKPGVVGFDSGHAVDTDQEHEAYLARATRVAEEFGVSVDEVFASAAAFIEAGKTGLLQD